MLPTLRTLEYNYSTHQGIPQSKQVLDFTQISNICLVVLLAHTPTQLQEKLKETLPCSRLLQSDQPPRKFLPNTEGTDPQYNQPWLLVQEHPDEYLANKILSAQVRDLRTGG